MTMARDFTYLFLICCISKTVLSSFFEVDYPNVHIQAEPKGNLTLEFPYSWSYFANLTFLTVHAGEGGNVVLLPGSQRSGTVIINGMDLRKLVDRVTSLPPVWITGENHDLLGTFLAGYYLSVNVQAKDPEGGNLTYSIISGELPPGILLNENGHIYGTAPDEDATYTFGIRATDFHGKFTDGIFQLEVREYDQCKRKPCKNGGTCKDLSNGFQCTCAVGYGGDKCQFHCASHALGVNAGEKTIPDAQMSAYLSQGTSIASNGRLNATGGWIGQGKDSWLQVDLGEEMQVYTVATQGYQSESYSIAAYRLASSQDGNKFIYINDAVGDIMEFSGSQHYNTIVTHKFAVPTVGRFWRFYPTRWKTNPGMRVELYGCSL